MNEACLNCGYNYNNAINLPRKLPCNHLICTKCLFDIQNKIKQIRCPQCQTSFQQELISIQVPFLPGQIQGSLKSAQDLFYDLQSYQQKLHQEQGSLLGEAQDSQTKINQKINSIINLVQQIGQGKIQYLDQVKSQVQKRFESRKKKVEQLIEMINRYNSLDQQKSQNLQESIFELISQQGLYNKNEAKVFFQDNIDQFFDQVEVMLQQQLQNRKEGSQIQAIQLTNNQAEVNSIKAILKQSTEKKIFKQNVKIEPTEGNFTQIEQFSEDGLLISGASSINARRFTILSQVNIQNYEMEIPRYWHRTRFNKKGAIFVISGITKIKTGYRDTNQCEVFIMDQQKFQSIQPIKIPGFGFGCDIFQDKVHVFGGFVSEYKNSLNNIQMLDSMSNQWIILPQTLPTFACASAVFVPGLQGFLIYKNNSELPTTIYDMKNVTERGDKYNGVAMQEYFQSFCNKNFVYQYDNGGWLHMHNVSNGKWEKVR